MPVVRLSGEPPCDPNQSDASPVIDYNRLTPGEAKETHPMIKYQNLMCLCMFDQEFYNPFFIQQVNITEYSD